MYTNNKPLAYVKESKLGVAEIWWLSKISLFDCVIKYRTDKSNSDIFSNNESDEYETLSYAVVCDELCEVIKGEKLPLDIKKAMQAERTKQLPDREKISAHSEMVDILHKVTPGMMKEAQKEDIHISKAICYAKFGKKPALAQIHKIKSRPVHRYLHQLDWLVFHQGVLHRVYEQDGSKYHQFILPIEFRAQVMVLLHDEQGHQAVEYSAPRCDLLGKKNVSSVKLPRVLILIQINHRSQL